MILSFGDVHLGETTYSTISKDGFYTAELETIKALTELKQVAAKPEITCIICTGDFFHTNHPAQRLINFVIPWLQDMDALGKPFYIIPGNHDASVYNHAIQFFDKLRCKNIILVNDTLQMPWYGWMLHFVAYKQDTDSRAKEKSFNDTMMTIKANLTGKDIIVSHFVETEARTGSEAYLISRKVENIAAEQNPGQDVIYLLGHIHRQQYYTKHTGARVIYTGSITYNDMGDLGQQKGYVLIDEQGNVTLERLNSIRLFQRYFIESNTNPLDMLKRVRLTNNSVLFLESPTTMVDSDELRSFLSARNIMLGKMVELPVEQAMVVASSDIFEMENPVDIFSRFIEASEFTDKHAVTEYGQQKLLSIVGTK